MTPESIEKIKRELAEDQLLIDRHKQNVEGFHDLYRRLYSKEPKFALPTVPEKFIPSRWQRIRAVFRRLLS